MQGTLYHRPPTRVRGSRLLPLNSLREQYPDVHEVHSKKYQRAPELLQQQIPHLDCTWGDVVFLSPVHPAPLFAALRVSGRTIPDVEPWTLTADRLDPSRTVIRLMRAGATGHYPDQPDDDDYLPFTTAGLRAVNRVTV